MSANQITAAQIIELLAIRHSGDVFVPECKDGPTHYKNHVRMDAWVMPRSWVRPETTAYEIKVSRRDWLADDKWHRYLPLCHRFYFVCPAGLIDVAECPAEAGLLYVSKNGTKLFTKKKSSHRDVQVPEDVWRYVLMCRARIDKEGRTDNPGDYWREWLTAKRANHELGYQIRGRIAEVVKAADKRAREAEEKSNRYESVREAMRELGINPDIPTPAWDIKNRVRAAIDGDAPSLIRKLENAMKDIDRLRLALEQASKQGELLDVA